MSPKKQKNISLNIIYCPACKKEFFKKYRKNQKFCCRNCYFKWSKNIQNSGRYKKNNIPWTQGKILSQEMKNKMKKGHLESNKNKEEKHWNWKGGCRSFYRGRAKEILKKACIEKKCFICNEKNEKIHIHHIDHNYKNNTLENLKYLCIICHTRLHHQGEKKNNKKM